MRLWRMMLPGLSFPACGLSLDVGSTIDDDAAADRDGPDEIARSDGSSAKPRSPGGAR